MIASGSFAADRHVTNGCAQTLVIAVGQTLGQPLATVGVASYAIYMATIDYMICAYGPYSASATGDNGWSRDFLAGVLTVPATQFYQNIGPDGRHLQYASTILFCISVVLVIVVYVIYWKGPVLRKRSPFAQHLAMQTQDNKSKRDNAAVEVAAAMTGTMDGKSRPSRVLLGSRRSSQQRFQQESRVRSNMSIRVNSRAHTPASSRRPSVCDRRGVVHEEA